VLSDLSHRLPGGPAIDILHVDGGRSGTSDIVSQGGRRRHFFVLMVSALGSLTSLPRGALSTFYLLMVGAPKPPTPPPRGSTVNVFCVDGGRSQISDAASQGGGAIDVFCIDRVRSWISDIASQGLTVDVSCVDDGRSRISGTTSQGARRRRFTH
jgi:hypothetical protein